MVGLSILITSIVRNPSSNIIQFVCITVEILRKNSEIFPTALRPGGVDLWYCLVLSLDDSEGSPVLRTLDSYFLSGAIYSPTYFPSDFPLNMRISSPMLILLSEADGTFSRRAPSKRYRLKRMLISFLVYCYCFHSTRLIQQLASVDRDCHGTIHG